MPATITSAVRVSAASAAWTFTASTTAIAAGLATGSLALVAFGAVQMFDFVADVVLVVHFRADGGAEHLERVVLRIVAAGLLAVGSVTIVISILHLIHHEAPSDSPWNIALAAASVVALTALAIRKRYLAVRLPSPALRADGNLTAIGAALAVVTVKGTFFAIVFGWWWADPAAAMFIAVGALYVGATTGSK